MSTNDHPADATNINGSNDENRQNTGKMKDNSGWDGKLRVDRHPVITNPEALEDPDYSDEDAPLVEEIDADEGMDIFFIGRGVVGAFRLFRRVWGEGFT